MRLPFKVESGEGVYATRDWVPPLRQGLGPLRVMEQLDLNRGSIIYS